MVYFNIVEFVGLGKLDLVQILVLIFFSPPLPGECFDGCLGGGVGGGGSSPINRECSVLHIKRR